MNTVPACSFAMAWWADACRVEQVFLFYETCAGSSRTMDPAIPEELVRDADGFPTEMCPRGSQPELETVASTGLAKKVRGRPIDRARDPSL